MKIISLKRKSKKLKEKFSRQWHKLDHIHYGRKVHFKKKPFIFAALEKKEILGYIQGYILEGVGKIDELIVEEKSRRKGIGKKLVLTVEDLCRKNNCHKIVLITGKNWQERKFYKRLGYKTTAYLKNHWGNIDFVILEKYL